MSLFLNVVDGVGGGRLLGLPWHVIRAFVKERLAMSAFSFYQYGYPSASWGSDCKVGTIPSREVSMVRALGCLCTGWKRGVVGTLSCTDRIGVGIYFGGMAQAGDNARLLDIKKNLSRLYEMTAIGVMGNKEMAKEIKSMSETVSYTLLQVSIHDARITKANCASCWARWTEFRKTLRSSSP